MLATDVTTAGGTEPADGLRRVLDATVARRWPGRRIARVERRLAPYRSSRWLEDVTLHLDDGAVIPLVYKDAVRPVPGTERVKPADVMDSGREAWVYQHVLGRAGRERSARAAGGAPRAWAVLVGPDGDRRGLLLERLEGVPLAEVGSPDAWRAAARWLAGFHGRGLPARWDEGAPLLLHDPALHARWLERAARSGALAVLDPAARERLLEVHRLASDLVLSAPPTLLHGEFYPSNLIVRRGPSGWAVHPVDWEMAGAGAALLDLAALTSGAWGADDRKAIALAYLRARRDASDEEGIEAFLRRLTAARLLLAVQWLGWSEPTWVPPAHHRTDWLAAAGACIEELGR